MINFDDDIEKLSISSTINYNDENITYKSYDNKIIAEKLKDWYNIFTLCRSKLVTKPIYFKLLYCYLTNSLKVTENYDYDVINLDYSKKIRIKIIDNNNSIIKIRPNSIYDTVIIFDCTDMRRYKIYQFSSKILLNIIIENNNFTILCKKYKFKPIFISNIDNIVCDYKKLSKYNNFYIIIDEYIENIEKILDSTQMIEKELQEEFNKLINSTHIYSTHCNNK